MPTVIMYHYVRDLASSRHPRIKGLTIERFEGQLDYVASHYEVVSPARIGEPGLPANACALTFDDGFIDHAEHVLPAIKKHGMLAGFYPPAQAIEEHRMLDVHKIQFLLASTADHGAIAGTLMELTERHRAAFGLASAQVLRERYAKADHLDTADVVFIKHLLQHVLPSDLRSVIVSDLFARHVSDDEVWFARTLYMNIDQIRSLRAAGMDVGGHGYRHIWLGTVPASEQREEITATLRFLDAVGRQPREPWTMCYPYGSYDATTLRLVREHGCRVGLTTHPGLLKDANYLECPRLDTIDLPFDGSAPANAWTLRATN